MSYFLARKNLYAKLRAILKTTAKVKADFTCMDYIWLSVLIKQQVNPAAWYRGTPAKSNLAKPVITKLKQPSQCSLKITCIQ